MALSQGDLLWVFDVRALCSRCVLITNMPADKKTVLTLFIDTCSTRVGTYICKFCKSGFVLTD